MTADRWVPVLVCTLLAVSITIGLEVARETWQRRNTAGKTAFAFAMLCLCCSEWSLFYLLELLASTLPTKILYYNLKQLGANLAMPWLLLFVLYYSNPTFRLRIWQVALIFAEPAAMMLLAWTNPWHHLIVSRIAVRHYMGFLVLEPVLGRMPLLNTIYSIFFFAGTVALLGAHYARSPRFYRMPLRLILIGISFTAVGGIITAFGLIHQYFELAPILLGVTLPLFDQSTRRHRMFYSAQIARDVIFDHMNEGAVLLNPDGETIDINLAATRILTGNGRVPELGAPGDRILPDGVDLEALRHSRQAEALAQDGSLRYLLFRYLPLDLSSTSRPFALILISDVTERVQAQQQLTHSNLSLENANQQLEVTNQRIHEQIQLVRKQAQQLQLVNTELNKKRQTEAELGAQVQQSLLVSHPPHTLQGVQLATLSIPSQHVDGDFCDFYTHSNTLFDVLVGDVMGKGLSAALLGAAAKAQMLRAINSLLSHSHASELPSPQRLVQQAHRRMTPRLIELDTFVTIAYARFDLQREELLFVDCGHTATIHYCAQTAKTRLLQGDNVPFGVLEAEEYHEFRVSIAAGDKIVFYSDGVTEARDGAGEMYGMQRLQSLIARVSGGSAGWIAAALRRDLERFSGSASFADDVTCIVVSIEATGAMSGWNEIKAVLEPVFVPETFFSEDRPWE